MDLKTLKDTPPWDWPEGADKMFTTFAPEMKKYSERVHEIMNEVWDSEDYHQWAGRWLAMCGVPPAKLEARRQAYEASRKREKERVIS